MTIVTTEVVDLGKGRNWDILPGQMHQTTAIPRSERVYTGATVVPAKILTDTSHFKLSCRLPTNFVYRLLALQMSVLSPSLDAIQDFSPGMMITILVDGFIERQFPIYGLSIERIAAESFMWSLTSAESETTSFALEPGYGGPYSEVIESFGASSDSQIIVDYIDGSNDSTVAIVVRHWVRVLQYDIEQVHHYPMHSPQPIISM